MASGLLDKANIILTPTGYKAGTMYNVAPIEQPYEDFVFSRASVASRVNSSGLVEMVGRTLGSNLVQNGDFSEIGSELVTNGDFATDSNWSGTGSNGISISDGKLNFNNTPYTRNSAQSNVTTVGKTYKVVFTVSDYVKGNVRIFLGGSATSTASANGTYAFYLTASSNTTIGVQVMDGSGTTLSVDNVSVKQVDPNDYWTLGTGWSLGDDEATSDGVSGNSNLYQENILTVGKTYKVSVDVTRNSGEVRFYITSDPTATITSSGTFIFYGVCDRTDLDFHIKSVYFDGSITNVSVQEVIDTNNIPRINYDSNGENGHWLLEPTSTNLLPYSEDFSNVTENALTVTDNVTTSPQGLSNAASIIPNNTNTVHYLSYPNNTTGTVTFSIYAKSNGYNFIFLHLYDGSNGRAWFNLENGQVETTDASITSKIESVGSGWYRCIITRVLTGSLIQADIAVSNADNTVVFPGDGTSGVYIWGAQVEALPYATSYIPTLTGSTVTRATETANGAGSADLINSTEGVLYAEIAGLVDADASDRVISLSDNSITNRVEMKLSSSGSIQGRFDSASSDITLTETGLTASNFNKIALVWSSGKCALFINGVKEQEDLTFNTFASNVLFDLSFDSAYLGGSSNFYGEVKALAVFNEALSDSELTELTS